MSLFSWRILLQNIWKDTSAHFLLTQSLGSLEEIQQGQCLKTSEPPRDACWGSGHTKDGRWDLPWIILRASGLRTATLHVVCRSYWKASAKSQCPRKENIKIYRVNAKIDTLLTFTVVCIWPILTKYILSASSVLSIEIQHGAKRCYDWIMEFILWQKRNIKQDFQAERWVKHTQISNTMTDTETVPHDPQPSRRSRVTGTPGFPSLGATEGLGRDPQDEQEITNGRQMCGWQLNSLCYLRLWCGEDSSEHCGVFRHIFLNFGKIHITITIIIIFKFCGITYSHTAARSPPPPCSRTFSIFLHWNSVPIKP